MLIVTAFIVMLNVAMLSVVTPSLASYTISILQNCIKVGWILDNDCPKTFWKKMTGKLQVIIVDDVEK